MNRERRSKPLRASSETDKNQRPSRKREKYTRQACETCKARKVKCSGTLPCSRCVELRVDCLYQDREQQFFLESTAAATSVDGSSIQRSEHMAKRRRTSTFSNKPELEQLVLTMRKMCDEIELSTAGTGASNDTLSSPSAAVAAGNSPSCSLKRSRRHPVLLGEPKPTKKPVPGYVHLLGMARDLLVEKGYYEGMTMMPSIRPDEEAINSSANNNVTSSEELFQAAKPILDLGLDKALEYHAIFKDHVYCAYPCINLRIAEERTTALFRAASSSPRGDQFQDLGFDMIDVELMKVVFSIAMILQGEDDDDQALCNVLTEQLLWSVDNNIDEDRAQVEDIIMATLMTIYQTLRNEPVKAWRMIRFAATTSLELGLHKEKKAMISAEEGTRHNDAMQYRDLFSTVYGLDRRCSFFANLPWTLHHKDIEPNVLCLSAMLKLDRIHTDITRFNVTAASSNSIKDDDVDEQAEVYDYRVQKLVESVTTHGLLHTNENPLVQSSMLAFLQMRANHLRIAVHMRYLSTSTRTKSTFQSQAVQTLVSLAIASVQVYVSGLTNASRLWRPIADRLLMAAISCMFLAASQNPHKYGPLCRSAFHTAIDCLKQSSYELAAVEAEVWCSLEDLQQLGAKIEMPLLLGDHTMDSDAGFPSLATFDNIDVSTEELVQLREDNSQNELCGIWDATASLWETNFEFQTT